MQLVLLIATLVAIVEGAMLPEQSSTVRANLFPLRSSMSCQDLGYNPRHILERRAGKSNRLRLQHSNAMRCYVARTRPSSLVYSHEVFMLLLPLFAYYCFFFLCSTSQQLSQSMLVRASWTPACSSATGCRYKFMLL